MSSILVQNGKTSTISNIYSSTFLSSGLAITVELKYVMSFLTWARYHARLQDTCQNTKYSNIYIARCFTWNIKPASINWQHWWKILCSNWKIFFRSIPVDGGSTRVIRRLATTGNKPHSPPAKIFRPSSEFVWRKTWKTSFRRCVNFWHIRLGKVCERCHAKAMPFFQK